MVVFYPESDEIEWVVVPSDHEHIYEIRGTQVNLTSDIQNLVKREPAGVQTKIGEDSAKSLDIHYIKKAIQH